MKFIGILLLLVAVAAIEASPQGDKISLDKVNLVDEVRAAASIKCDVDDDCPRGYGCRCDEFAHVCIRCKECTNDQFCKDKYSNPESACKCTHNLCVGCVA